MNQAQTRVKGAGSKMPSACEGTVHAKGTWVKHQLLHSCDQLFSNPKFTPSGNWCFKVSTSHNFFKTQQNELQQED
jgi:hypothetical protein